MAKQDRVGNGGLDLHGGEPFWLVRNGLGVVVPPLDRDLVCDVAILGGGITGALMAHAMASAGLAVVVLDRRHIGRGSTAASTALLQYDLDVPLHQLRERIGGPDAERAFKLGVEGIELLRKLCEPLDAGFQARPSVYVARGSKPLAALRLEFQARTECGLDVEWLDAQALLAEYGLLADGGIRSAIAAEVDPYRLTQHLIAECIKMGVTVHDRTEVTEIDESETSVDLRTRTGPSVHASWVVHATGYESSRELPRGAVKLHSTFAVVSEPLRESPTTWTDRALIWEMATPYLYARLFEDRLVFGGRDVSFRNAAARDRLISVKSRGLCRDLRGLCPTLDIQPAFSWAGTFGSTDDGIGYVGVLPGRPRALFALGFGGNGITTSAVASRIGTDLVLGRGNPDARLYRFGR